MMTIRLILNDGTIIENGWAGLADGFLWLWLPGWTIQQAAAVAFDPSRTGKIVYQYGEMQDEFEGFTNCTNLMQGDGEAAVCLTKGVML